MPAGRPSKTASKAPLTHKQIQGIWAELKPAQLHEQLRARAPQGRWALQGSRIAGCCPYHDDSAPSFHIYLDRGYAKCYGCDRYEWNPVALWAHLRETTLAAAFTELKQQFGVRTLPAAASAQIEAWERNQQAKRVLANMCHEALVDAIRDPKSEGNRYAQSTVDYLINTRQLPREALPALAALGILPSVATLTKLLQGRRDARPDDPVDAIVKKLVDNSSGWVGSLMFRLDVSPAPSAAVGRLKLRRPGTHDFLLLDDDYDDGLGFMGLGWDLYKGMIGNNRAGMSSVYVVEGEFDALSIHARQLLAGGPRFVVLSAGGKMGVATIDHLHELGVDQVYLMTDAPAKEGDVLTRAWLPTINRLRCRVFTGYDAFPGNVGDPDEMVVSCGLDSVERVWLDTSNPTYFQLPQEWVFNQAVPQLDKIDESDTRYRIEVAAELGRLLKNVHDCDAYINMCAARYGVTPGELKRAIIAREETEPGYILRILDVLLAEFFVIGQKVSEKDRYLYLWHRRTRIIYKVSLADDGSIERELGAALGPAYAFFEEHVGIPPFLAVADAIKEGGKYLQKQDKDLRFYLRQALTLAAHNAPDYMVAMHKSQGLHVIRNASGGTPTLYLVNGQSVYHGVFDEQEHLRWTELGGPSHEDIIFDVGLRHTDPAWLESVQSVADLARADAVDLRATYNTLHDMLDVGWAFKNHALTVDFLAAHIMAMIVCNAFRRQVVVALHADTSSGKTKLLLGLLGRHDAPRIHVVSAAVGMPNFSAAGVRQTMDNKTRPLCLDEFEDDGAQDRKCRTVSEILEMIRGGTGETNTYTMGSRDGQPKVYNLNFFIFIAAISRVRRAQDANRMVSIYLEHKDGRRSPVDIILDKYGDAGVTALRRDLDVGLFPRIAQIMRCHDEIEREFAREGARPLNVESRFFEALYPAMSIMKLLGLDYKAFAEAYCRGNAETYAVTSGGSDSSALLHWLVNSPRVPVMVGDQRALYPIIQILCAPDLRAQLNMSGSGVYVDETTNTLVVNWMAAVQVILRDHARFGRETNVQNLRELASRSRHAISERDLLSSGVLARLRHCGLAGVPASHLSAFNATTLLAEGGYKDDVPTASDDAPASAPAATKKVNNDDFGD